MLRYYLIAISLFFAMPAIAQQSVGSIVGHVKVASEDQAAELHIRAEEVTTEANIELAELDSAGNFAMRNLPFATYDLYLVAPQGTAFIKRVVVHSAIAARVDIETLPDFSRTEII